MKTFILGIIVTVGVLFGYHVYADTIIPDGIKFIKRSDDNYVSKYYDYDNHVVCYTDAQSISCLRN